jgi:hypothetical protein
MTMAGQRKSNHGGTAEDQLHTTAVARRFTAWTRRGTPGRATAYHGMSTALHGFALKATLWPISPSINKSFCF